MPPMNLRWRILGRPVKPVAFSLMFSMFVLFFSNIQDTGLLRNEVEGDVLAGAGLAVATLLGYAWVSKSQSAAELGLAGACFVWTARFWLSVFLTDNPTIHEGVWLSLAWSIVAGGSYWLEKTDVSVRYRDPRSGGQ